MKSIIKIRIIALGLLYMQPLNAQFTSPEKVEDAMKKDGKYALLVQSSRHLMSSVSAGERYKEMSKEIDFHIVLIGPVVKELAEDKELIPFIEKAASLGIPIVVCEFAMKRLGVKKEDYPSSVYTTANGYSYIFGLQELGFKTIEL